MEKAIIYIAVDYEKNIFFLDSKNMNGSNFDCTNINDRFNLEEEFSWNCEIPDNVGMHMAIISWEPSVSEDIKYSVIQCTPMSILY